ncbi:MAG TPA: NADH-quinone oxidoreductase subunit NuoF [Polyangiaceae bacterium]|nr:NADH-quinone oxidoreductase subunit NuoF [Polyangiaceae bacterium]
MLKRTDYLTRVYGKPEGWSLATYERDMAGYQVARRVLTTMTREQVVDEAKKANIRGRGGAGFPMGVKWGFMPKAAPAGTAAAKPHYLIVNADESEPGTHKDRTLMELNPHACIEGAIIACYGIGAHVAYVYVRGELDLSMARLEGAIQEVRAKGYLGKTPFGKDYPIEVYVHSGAGAYICGEETSMLNSIEGRRGEPRNKPPFPANAGAFGCPTTVNNLESIASVPAAFGMGCEAFSKLSALHPMNDGGVRLYGLNGHVKKPGVVELAVGPTLNELIYDVGGGVLGDRGILCAIPGGSSTPVLRPQETVNAPDPKSPLHQWHGKSVFDLPLGVDTMRAVGTMLGTCCVTVIAEGTDPVFCMQNLMQFYRHESCGQCTPCREGSGWLERVCEKILDGKASMQELDGLSDIANGIMGNTICAFGEGTAMPALAFLQKFRPEFEAYVRGERTRADAKLTVEPWR